MRHRRHRGNEKGIGSPKRGISAQSDNCDKYHKRHETRAVRPKTKWAGSSATASQSFQKHVMSIHTNGRFVSGGDYVLYESVEALLFNIISSIPATTEAATPVAMYGLVADHTLDIADTVQAYIQSQLGTTGKYKRGNSIQVATWGSFCPGIRPSIA